MNKKISFAWSPFFHDKNGELRYNERTCDTELRHDKKGNADLVFFLSLHLPQHVQCADKSLHYVYLVQATMKRHHPALETATN